MTKWSSTSWVSRLYDPPKTSAAAAVAALSASGVAVNIITGDNELVTRHVCTELGLPIRAVLTGDDLQHLDDLALQARVEAANLFCRVTPPQKNRIVLALKARDHTVSYLGDGINDAPSLHRQTSASQSTAPWTSPRKPRR